MFQESQDKEYFSLCVHRAKKTYLVWVEQFLDIISENADMNTTLKLNDIGCNLGQFWKGLKRRDFVNIDYNGFDYEEMYVEEAKNIFPEVSEKFNFLDIEKTTPPQCDITVCSATLEHMEYLQPSLENMLESTDKLFLLRTFLGEIPLKSLRMKKNAKTYYNIHQFSFNEIMLSFHKLGFSSKILRDLYTDSMPSYIGNGVIRTFYTIQGFRKEL